MKTSLRSFGLFALVLALFVPALADTIRLKDGNVIRGQVIGFRDQQFTVLVGSGTKGRHSRTLIYIEDVDSIEFDSATTAAASALANDDASATNSSTQVDQLPRSSPPPNTNPTNRVNRTPPPLSSSSASPLFFAVKVNVPSDKKNTGWRNSSLVVRQGQLLRISASGRISLGSGRYSTPAGDSRIPSGDKLISSEPTGALVAVIGDDDDNFFVIGTRREFVAQRDGVLFLAVNDSENGAADNVGSYDVVIEAEARKPRSQ